MAKVPVLLVHAFPLDARMWRGQVDLLCTTRSVLAPDLRGFGSARHAPPALTVDQHANDLVDYLDRASIARAIVVGLSMGGYISLALQRLAEHRVAGLVLCDTKAPADMPEMKKARDVRIERLRREGIGFLPDEMIDGLVAKGCPTSVRNEVMRIMREQDADGAVSALMALRDRPNATSSLSSIRVPTTFICGELDAITQPEIMKADAQAVEGSTFTIIPGAGHLSNLEKPEAFNAALMALVNKIDTFSNSK